MAKLLEEGRPLPPLRRDLRVHRGPVEDDGRPTYTIQDPIRAQFFKIGWAEGEILRCFRTGMTPEQLVESVNKNTTLNVVDKDIIQFFEYLVNLDLLHLAKPSEYVESQAAKSSTGWLQWALNSYLFFRIPLWSPDAFLERTLPYVQLLVSPLAWMAYAILTFVGIAAIAVRIDDFTSTFWYFFNWRGLIFYSAAASCVKCVHELAHAYTAKRYGVHVPTMGVAVLVFWPALYTDVTDSWKLWKRHQRIAISVAGVAAELVVAGLATFVWAISPPGYVQGIAFVLATASWISSFLLNLNPVMRWDGYYLLMDVWGIDNLHPRAYAVARWNVRKQLLGIQVPPPEPNLAATRIWGLTVFSIVGWLYRLFIFTSIALFIYYTFTKSLGIVLMLVQFFYLVVKPIVTEITQLQTVKQHIRKNPRMTATFVACGLLAIYFVLPWPHLRYFPAITAPVERQILWVPVSGEIEKLLVKRGDHVQKGDVIALLKSHELDRDFADLTIEQARVSRRKDILEQEAQGHAFLPETEAQIESVQAQLTALKRQQEGLVIRAEIDGEIISWDDLLRVGQTVKKDQQLGQVADTQKVEIVAYLPEEKTQGVEVGYEARFRRSSDLTYSYGKLSRVQKQRELMLRYPQLSSEVGGDLPVTREELVDSYYEATMTVDEADKPLRLGDRGDLEVRGPWRSYLVETLRYLLSLFWQQSAL